MVVELKDQEYHRLSWKAACVRNIIRPLDALGGYLIGAFSLWHSSRRQRLGDRLGKTVVVRAESVPSTSISPFQEKRLVRGLLLGLILFLCLCLSFSYIGRPPLSLQGLYNTRAFPFDRHTLTPPTLGNPRWDFTDGTLKVTYPITYLQEEQGQKQQCRGEITLIRPGVLLDWKQERTEIDCSVRVSKEHPDPIAVGVGAALFSLLESR
jgi:hypothetical protein